MESSLKFIDLFSGAGGLSEGLTNAGFHSLFASEIVPVYAQTYQKNHADTEVCVDDIRGVDAEKIRDGLGLNWENVSKRILPQLIYKGQVLQREELCRTGLFFVCPSPVFARVLNRLGGKDNLPIFPMQPASINFVSYDYLREPTKDGCVLPLGIIAQHSTTVYKIQEAFSSVSLPNGNVYRDAIMKALYE